MAAGTRCFTQMAQVLLSKGVRLRIMKARKKLKQTAYSGVYP
jgi:hypothetical protein